jgi:hypothetical protein
MENNDLSIVEKRLVARFLDMFIKGRCEQVDRAFIISSLLTFKIFITPEFGRIYSKICFFAPSPPFFGAYLAFWT